jgi:hypothetical protein
MEIIVVDDVLGLTHAYRNDPGTNFSPSQLLSRLNLTVKMNPPKHLTDFVFRSCRN